MKAIKIDEKNMPAIEAAVKEGNGKARMRTLTAEMIFRAIETVEKKLDIPKTHMTGIVVNADLFADSYTQTYTSKGIPQSTCFCMERRASGWYLTAVERRDTGTARKKFRVTLPEEAQQAIVRRFELF